MVCGVLCSGEWKGHAKYLAVEEQISIEANAMVDPPQLHHVQLR